MRKSKFRHGAGTHLSRLVELVLEGKEVVIGKTGRQMVKLIPYNMNETKPWRPG